VQESLKLKGPFYGEVSNRPVLLSGICISDGMARISHGMYNTASEALKPSLLSLSIRRNRILRPN
jgi:hypothetical protein